MKIIKAKDYEDMSRKAANIISAQVILKPDCVLGLATGSTPIGAYKQLAAWYKKGDVVLMRYADGALATTYRKADGGETLLGSIPGLDLKKALFAIWLGDVPAQESPKKSLLAAP